MSLRHFGLDIHKNFVMVAAVNSQQEIIQEPLRVEMPVFEDWIKRTLGEHDRCVLEVSNNSIYMICCKAEQERLSLLTLIEPS